MELVSSFTVIASKTPSAKLLFKLLDSVFPVLVLYVSIFC